MTTQSENFAPYASFGNMQIVLKRIRGGWTPPQIDVVDLEKIGISKSTVNRAMAALVFLGLVDEEGRTNDNTWKAIATATESEYPEILAGILRSAYSNIFEIYPNPADATDVQIANAFRRSEPLQQRDRMVSLFRGLCQEANLIAGEPLTREQKPFQKTIPMWESSSKKNVEPHTVKDAVSRPENISNNPVFGKTIPPTPTLGWYNDLGMATLMSRLPRTEKPNERPKWTKAEKERWLTALQGMLDLLIDVED